MTFGTFAFENKVRPGAYINFKSTLQNIEIGKRGTLAIARKTKFGNGGELLTIKRENFRNGDYEAVLTDYTLCETIKKAFDYCDKILIYTLGSGGSASSWSGDNGTIMSKYAGSDSNKITLRFSNNMITTLFKYKTVDVRPYSTTFENQYVKAMFFLDPEEGAEFRLTGGADVVYDKAKDFQNYINALKKEDFSTFTIVDESDDYVAETIEAVKLLRDKEGKYVQGIVCDISNIANYEGVIKTCQALVFNDGIEIGEHYTPILVGALTASSNCNESNTYRVIDNLEKTKIQLDNEEIEEKLKQGYFLFTKRIDGKYVVEQDINSLTDYTTDKSYVMSKNRVLRVLDEIGKTISITFQNKYIGKVSNNQIGRNSFAGDLIKYLQKLEASEAIENFIPESDIKIRQGANPDSVIVDLAIQPVDSMEKLYMTVEVN